MTEPGNLLEVRHPYWVDGEGSGLWPFNKHTNVYALALVVKTGPGKLYGFTVYNSGAAQFVQVHDCTTVPASGAIPAAVFAAGATANLGVYFGDTGRAFNAGCVIVNSSTGPTYTAGSADCFIDAQYLQMALVSTMVTPPLAESDVTGLTTDLAAKTAKATLTTKGDIYAASAASTPARVAVGAAGTALVASSGAASGVAYGGVQVAAAPPVGAPTGLPFAYDTTAVTGGFYFWNGAAWVAIAAILQMAALTGDTLDLVQGGVVTSSAQIVDNGATTGDVLTVQADKSIAAAAGGSTTAGAFVTAQWLFTETAGAGVYTKSVAIPAKTTVLDVLLYPLGAPWDADTAAFDMGDVLNGAQSYYNGVDLVTPGKLYAPYDPTSCIVGVTYEALGAGDSGNYGSAGLLYQGDTTICGPGVRYAASDTITGTVTTTGTGGTTGRLLVVILMLSALTPSNAVKS